MSLTVSVCVQQKTEHFSHKVAVTNMLNIVNITKHINNNYNNNLKIITDISDVTIARAVTYINNFR